MLNYSACALCPRRCGVDRTRGETGYCGQSASLRAAKAMLHYGEEPPISGAYGTGIVFFSGCTLHCRYCQNAAISLKNFGKELSAARLREVFEALIDEGAQCVELNTPTQFLPSILPALTPKLPVPVVYNSGGYESVETLRELDGLIDIYLPDYKYADETLARRLSDAPNYPIICEESLREMYRQVGAAVVDEEGVMQRGMIVRHLVLPGCVENSLKVVERFAELFPKRDVLFSLMAQYLPMPGMQPPLDRRVTADEYAAVMSWAELCGVTNGFTQDLCAAKDELLPEFDLEGL